MVLALDLLARTVGVRPRPPDALWVILGVGLVVAGLAGLWFALRAREGRFDRRFAREAAVTVVVGIAFIVGGLA